jgi:hypothetical protein
MKKKIVLIFSSFILSIAAVEFFFQANSKYHFINTFSVKYDSMNKQVFFKSIPHNIITETNIAYKHFPEVEQTLFDKLNAMTQLNVRTFDPQMPSSYIKRNLSHNKNYLLRDKSYNPKLDRIIFDASYTMTAEGYRSVPFQKLSDIRKNIILVGCSLTFGTGVNDNQTIAHFLKKSLPNYNVINLGIPSGGINDSIDDILLRKRFQRINSNGGAVIYSFIPHHIERTLCKFECYRRAEDWILTKNNYTFEQNGNLLNLGTFKDSRSKLHNFTYHFLALSETLKFFSYKSTQIPYSDEQITFAKYLKFLSLEYKKKKLDFYFFTLYPEFLSQAFYDKLAEYGIQNISYSLHGLPTALQNKITIPGDGHYTEVGNYLISSLFTENLKEDNY